MFLNKEAAVLAAIKWIAQKEVLMMKGFKKMVALVLAASFAFLMAGCCGPQTPADKGYMMYDDTYLVYSADGLAAWIEAARNDPSTDCMLLDNITIPAGMKLEQIGASLIDEEQYVGTFNGNGKTISGVTSTIFGYLGEGGLITNLTLEVNIALESVPGISSYNCVGGMVEDNRGGRIENCTVKGSVSTSTTYSPCHVGGIVGYNTTGGTVYNCRSEVNVTATSSDANGVVNVGGIVGRNDGSSVRGCVATGNISGSATTENLGGIVGASYSASTIKGCTNQTNIIKEIGNG